MKKKTVQKSKYLLNVNGKKYKANTLFMLLLNFILGKSVNKKK